MSYLGLFMDTYKVTRAWFYIGEFVYMIWCVSSVAFANISRNAVIRYGGLLWALAFLLPLFPLSDTNDILKGLHFTFTLCFYDGALTVTSLAHSSLLADLAVSTAKRSQWNKYSAWFGVVGANSIVLSNLPAFRVLSFFLALVASAMFLTTAIYLAPLENQVRRSIEATPQQAETSTLKLSWQLFRRNFIIYCIIGVIQVFNCHFNSNLLALVLERVFPDSAWIQTMVLFGSAVLPQLFVALLADHVVTYGLYAVVCGLLFAKIGIALLNAVLGDPGVILFAALFLLANKVVTEVLCRHSGLVVSDVIDEDAFLYRRNVPLSSLVFGVWGLATRPGQSLGPVLGWSVFSLGQDSHSRLFLLLSLVPVACGTVQLLLWSQYTLKGPYLKHVKDHRSKGPSWDV